MRWNPDAGDEGEEHRGTWPFAQTVIASHTIRTSTEDERELLLFAVPTSTSPAVAAIIAESSGRASGCCRLHGCLGVVVPPR